MNGRVYDPRLGRMLSPDPFVSTPTYSQSYNRYTYAYNNPLKYTDPTGYFAPNINRGTGGWNGMISGVSRSFNLGRPTFTQGNYGDNYFYRGDGLYTLGPNIVNYAQVYNNYVVPESGDDSQGLFYTKTSDGWGVAGYYSSEGDKYCGMFNNITIVPVGNGNSTTQDLRIWDNIGIGSAGGGLDEQGSNISMQEVATGVGAFSLANGVKGNLVEWGMKGADWGKAGARYVKYVKGLGYVGAGLTTTYTVGSTGVYYYNGGTDWQVGTKATLDVVMTGAAFFWPIGTAVSGAYFILDVSTGGFGGFGEIKP